MSAEISVKFGLSFVFGRNYIATFGPVSVSAEFIKISSGRSLNLTSLSAPPLHHINATSVDAFALGLCGYTHTSEYRYG